MTWYRLLMYTVLNLTLTWIGTYFLPKLSLYHDTTPPTQLLVGSVIGSMVASFFLYKWFTREYPRWWNILTMLVLCVGVLVIGRWFLLDYVHLANMGGVPLDYFAQVERACYCIGISFSVTSVFFFEAIYQSFRRYTDSPEDTRIPLQ